MIVDLDPHLRPMRIVQQIDSELRPWQHGLLVFIQSSLLQILSLSSPTSERFVRILAWIGFRKA